MKKVTLYLLGLFTIVLLSSCTEQSLEDSGEEQTTHPNERRKASE